MTRRPSFPYFWHRTLAEVVETDAREAEFQSQPIAHRRRTERHRLLMIKARLNNPPVAATDAGDAA